jgi:hypothetical protein
MNDIEAPTDDLDALTNEACSLATRALRTMTLGASTCAAGCWPPVRAGWHMSMAEIFPALTQRLIALGQDPTDA